MSAKPFPRSFRSLPVAVGRLSLAALLSTFPASSQELRQPDGDGPPDPQLTCLDLPDGSPCPGVTDSPGDCVMPTCRSGSCQQNHPVADNRPCNDVDGNVCTEARCVPTAGTCDQSSTVPDGTSCSDGTPDFCGAQECVSGSCTTVGSHDPPDPALAASVEVAARPERVTEDEAFIDCCVFCSHQSLEALVPTGGGPERREADGGLPLRRKLCGRVLDYGVHDERDDPRDMLINIEPGPGFEDFLTGSLHTNCSKMTGDERDRFDVSDADCPIKDCLAAIPAAEADPNRERCVHVEVTPADQFEEEDSRFLPFDDGGDCGDSWDCDSELEGIEEACVYGVYAIDHGEDHRAADHQSNCCIRDHTHDYVEIHPFDAVWWPHPERAGFMFAVFQDDSNRYSSPHCGSQNNDNRWSQAPRDVTFEFPFRFDRSEAPIKACLRHVQTTGFDGSANEVLPLNVSTEGAFGPMTEVKSLQVDAKTTLLTVVEQSGFEKETQVRVDGCVSETEFKGVVTVRVAVGCSSPMDCSQLTSWNPNGRHDSGDAGSGYYFEELTFESGACP